MSYPATHPTYNHNHRNGAKPIAIEVHRWFDLTNGNWRSRAFVKLTSALRTSGLLLALPTEDLKNLLFLLTFTTTSGDCLPTVHQLAHAMQVSEEKARQRMERLAEFLWQGKPLVRAVQRGNGMDAYTLAAGATAASEPVSGVENNSPTPNGAPSTLEPDVSPPVQYAPRELVIEASRFQFTRPRAEVERQIAQEMGREQPPAPSTNRPQNSHTSTPPPAIVSSPLTQETAKRWLMEVGVEQDWADYLIANFDLERIRRQLEWLPYRNAYNPNRMIVTAIEHDYEEPVALRRRKERP